MVHHLSTLKLPKIGWRNAPMSHLSHITAFCSGTAATDSTTGAAVGAAPGTGAISWGCSILGGTLI